jgi:hypothetical protein
MTDDKYVLLYHALDRQLTLDQVVETFRDFTVHVLQRETPVGVVLTRGPEVHVALLPAHRKRHIWRKELAQFLGDMLAAHGTVVTALSHDKDDTYLRRIGFKEYRFDMFNSYYYLKESRYVRT